MRKLYIDFDNTLFNTVEFNNDCSLLLEKYNISKEEQVKVFKDLNKDIFDYKEILEAISKKYKIDKELLFNDYNEILKGSYLYEDTIEFLEYYKDKFELRLLTWGNNEYQLEKIGCAKISKYFNELIITQKYKFDIEIDYKNSIFLDDNPRDLKGLMNKKSYKVIRLCRGKYKNYEKELEVISVNSLKEIIEKGLI